MLHFHLGATIRLTVIQIARKILGINTVIATASRPETVAWVKKLGATHVVNHREPLRPQLEKLGLKQKGEGSVGVKNVALAYWTTPELLGQVRETDLFPVASLSLGQRD